MRFSKVFVPILFLIYVNGVSFADSINLNTGEYHMDMGGGDSLNLNTGEYHMSLD